jgi:hypothetical protein
VTCTKTGSKNDLFLNCRRKPKELSKKELWNVAPALLRKEWQILVGDNQELPKIQKSMKLTNMTVKRFNSSEIIYSYFDYFNLYFGRVQNLMENNILCKKGFKL